jgi:opacity protein-like surface antigen
MALANATIADPMSSSGLYSNPALLPLGTNMPTLSVHSGYNSPQNLLTENLTVSFSDNEDQKLLLGATLIHNSSAHISLNNTRQLRFTQFNIDLSYVQKLAPSFSVGLKLNTNYGSTVSANSYTYNTSLGVIYAPSSMVSYGLVYKGTRFQNEWLGSGLLYFKTDEGQTQISTVELPQRLEIGTTLRFPSLAETPDFVLSFSNEKLFGKSGLVYRGGIEIFPFKKVSLQGGYFYSAFVKGGRLGFGLHFDPLKINYAFTNNNLDQSGKTHLLSVFLDV